MAMSSMYTHPIFQPGLVPLEERQTLAGSQPGPGQPLAPISQAKTVQKVQLADEPDSERKLAWKLARAYRARRAGWLGHMRSFLAVNGGLAAINVLSSIGSGGIYPWFLYVTASWGIGCLIHGLTYRGWVTDRRAELERASEVLGIPLEYGTLPPRAEDQLGASSDEPSALPAFQSVDIGHWGELIASSRDSLAAAGQTIESASLEPDVTVELLGQLQCAGETLERVQEAAFAIRKAIGEVAPEGVDALQAELEEIDRRIATTDDQRLATLITANRRLLEARREKLTALQGEEERLEATVVGLRLAAQNIRLDAARLNAGQVPQVTAELESSLRQLNDEVDIARQVENELGRL